MIFNNKKSPKNQRILKMFKWNKQKSFSLPFRTVFLYFSSKNAVLINLLIFLINKLIYVVAEVEESSSSSSESDSDDNDEGIGREEPIISIPDSTM